MFWSQYRTLLYHQFDLLLPFFFLFFWVGNSEIIYIAIESAIKRIKFVVDVLSVDHKSLGNCIIWLVFNS